MSRPPDQADDFDAMVQLCIDACKAVQDSGTPEMCALAEMLLALAGRELAKRMAEHNPHGA